MSLVILQQDAIFFCNQSLQISVWVCNLFLWFHSIISYVLKLCYGYYRTSCIWGMKLFIHFKTREPIYISNKPYFKTIVQVLYKLLLQKLLTKSIETYKMCARRFKYCTFHCKYILNFWHYFFYSWSDYILVCCTARPFESDLFFQIFFLNGCVHCKEM